MKKKSNEINITINGDSHTVPEGISVLQACELVGIVIPVFCYHKHLSVAGNCRMCMVEVSPGPKKPQASCALTATDGMIINTKSQMVTEARSNVLELLLINHPLDCPICDQGGECDLQDLALSFGDGRSKYNHDKRSVPDKFMGPFIKTIMNRCIHCTRCIRFSSEVAGCDALGMIGRGEHAEISSLEQTIDSELSGNLIDICPVGALTSKPYAFVSRPWELEKFPAISVFDAVGSNIRLDVRANKVLRIIPRENPSVNEVWIDDKTRFHYDALDKMRIDKPYLAKSKADKPSPATWHDALDYTSHILGRTAPEKIGFITGNLLGFEETFAQTSLAKALNVSKFAFFSDEINLPKNVANLKFNTRITEIEDSDLILIVNSNPKTEAPVLNSRIRKAYLAGASISLVGSKINLSYDYKHIGDKPDDLTKLFKQANFVKQFQKAKHPIIIIGYETLLREDAALIFEMIEKFVKANATNQKPEDDYPKAINFLPRTCGFNSAVSFISKLNSQFDPNNLSANHILRSAARGEIDVIYLLGTDDINLDLLREASDAGCVIIYQGHHGSDISKHADVILPGCCYAEKNSLYMNLEGHLQESRQAVIPSELIKEDWKIIKALSIKLNLELKFETLEELRDKIKFMVRDAKVEKPKVIKNAQANFKKKFAPLNHDYFSSDIISRNSKTLTEAKGHFSNNLAKNYTLSE